MNHFVVRRLLPYNLIYLKNIPGSNRHFYTQGQIADHDAKKREYFYFINDQGELFLDNMKIKNFTNSFKEKKFLSFFFKNLKQNETSRFTKEFPYLSLCGREHNYVRCSDVPLVFTTLNSTEDKLFLNNLDSMYCKFNPNLLYISSNGRVYHPLLDELSNMPTNIGFGLIKSNIALELFKTINESDNKMIFEYKSNLIELNSSNTNYKKMLNLVSKYSSFKE